MVLLIVSIYFGMTPEPQEIEYVKPAPKQSTDDLLDDGFDPASELGIISGDSLSKLPPEKRKQMEEYEKKGEEIFRKQFEKEADRILSVGIMLSLGDVHMNRHLSSQPTTCSTTVLILLPNWA